MPRRVAVAVLVLVLAALGLASTAGAADTWVRRAAPSPVPKATTLLDVDCVSTTDCTAVGYYLIHHQLKSQALVVRTTDGVHWTRPTVEVPTELFSQLYGVSCTSAAMCTAVGVYDRGTPSGLEEGALIIRTTDGATWTRVPARPGGLVRKFITLTAVDCITATHCRAVGSYPEARRPIVLRTTNGTDWYKQVTPIPGEGATNLFGIDCSTDQECTAVGQTETSLIPGHGGSLVLRTTDGKTWSIEPVPSQPAGGSAGLNDVSCTTATACTAVGITHVPGAGDNPLALRTVDGTTWNSVSPVTAAHTSLRSVSCSSSTECTAVGQEFEGTSGDPARAAGVRTTNGTTWTSLGPTFTRPEYGTSAISCPAPTRCVAVGAFTTTTPPGWKSLVLRED